MAELLNSATGKPEEVSDELLYQSLAAGTHMPVGAKALINPEGKLVFSPLNDVQQNLTQYGYRQPTQDDLDALAKHEKFGEGTVNVVKAGALGIARGATMGGSDLALSATGAVEPETLSGLEEENPITSKVSELGGAVGAAALMPESLPARVARGAEKVGEGAAAVLKAGAKAATSEGSLASKVLGSGAEIGAKGLGSAVEGAAYGLGQSVSEHSMGDPDLNGEKILANIGYGGLYGGALGTLLSAGSRALPAGVTKAQDALGGLYEKYVGKMVELPGPLEEGAVAAKTFEPGKASKAWAKMSSAVSGEPEQEIVQKMIDARNTAVERKSVAEIAKLADEQNKSLQQVYDTLEKTSREAQTARKEEMAALLTEHDPARPIEQLKSIRDNARHAIAEMKAEPALYPARWARELELISDHIESSTFEPKTAEQLFKRETAATTAYGKEPVEGAEQIARHVTGDAEKPLDSLTAADVHETLNDVKKKLGAIVPRQVSDNDARAVGLVKGVQSAIKEGLEKEGVWGDAAARQQSMNEALTDHIAAKDNFQREFMKKMKKRGYGYKYVMNPTKTQSWFNMINDPRGQIKTDVLQEFLGSSRKLTSEISKTYENAPFSAGAFDKEGFQALLDKEEKGILNRRNMMTAQPGGYGRVTDALTLGGAALLGGPMAFIGALGHQAFTAAKNPGGAIEKLVRLEKAANRTTNFINRTSSAIFKAGEEVSRGKPGAGAAGQIFLSPDERRKRFEKRSEEILDRNADPEAAVNHMTLATDHGYHAAPSIMGAMQQASLRGTAFLASKIPQPAIGPTPFSPGAKVSRADINKFDRYYDAVHDPLQVFGGLKRGVYSVEGTEALKTVYPQLYQEMSSELFTSLSSHKAKSGRLISYQKRLAVCAFLDAPLDSSLAPSNISANQATLAVLGQKQDNKEAAQSASMKLNIANRYETALQGASTREGET